jgi:hypothetical protein
MVGDADRDLAVVFHPRPLMGLQELQVAGDFAHGLFLVDAAFWPRLPGCVGWIV